MKLTKQILSKLIKEEKAKLTEGNMVNVLTKDIGKKKMKELVQYLWHVLDLAINKDFKLSSNGKILGVNVSKIPPKSIPDIKRRYGVDLSEGKLTEGKWKIKGKYLAKDGGWTSIPGAYDNDAVVISIKNDTFNLYRGRKGYYVAGNRYDKSFKNDKELVNWLNKEKAKYQGIDNR